MIILTPIRLIFRSKLVLHAVASVWRNTTSCSVSRKSWGPMLSMLASTSATPRQASKTIKTVHPYPWWDDCQIYHQLPHYCITSSGLPSFWHVYSDYKILPIDTRTWGLALTYKNSRELYSHHVCWLTSRVCYLTNACYHCIDTILYNLFIQVRCM